VNREQGAAGRRREGGACHGEQGAGSGWAAQRVAHVMVSGEQGATGWAAGWGKE